MRKAQPLIGRPGLWRLSEFAILPDLLLTNLSFLPDRYDGTQNMKLPRSYACRTSDM